MHFSRDLSVVFCAAALLVAVPMIASAQNGSAAAQAKAAQVAAQAKALQAKAATVEYERLRQTEFADHRVALIHGQMSSADKQRAMKRFAAATWWTNAAT